MPAHFLNELILIITAAFTGGFLARTLKLPPVLGYIASGVLFGALGKNIFSSYDSLLTLSQIGVTLLLFTLGFEVSPRTIGRIHKKVFFLGVLQVLLTPIVFLPILLMFHLSLSVSILFSILFSFSSTVVVVKILEEKDLLPNFPGNQVFIFLLLQDLFIVPIIFLFPHIFSTTTFSMQEVLRFLSSLAIPLVIFVFLFIISKLFLSKLLGIIFQYPSHEFTILATIFTAAFSIGILKKVGIPESIGAFLAGMVISDQGRNLAPLSEIRPLRDILLVLFFVMTGMLLNTSYLLDHFGMIFLLTALILAVKFLIILFLLLSFNYHIGPATFISSHLANIGEFAAVIGQVVFISGFITRDTYNILLAVFILSLLFVPAWIMYAQKFSARLMDIEVINSMFAGSIKGPKKGKLSEYKNHVVICGHGRIGAEVRKLLDMANIPYIIIDFDKKKVDALGTTGELILFGDSTDDEILKAAILRKAKALVVTFSDTVSQKKIVTAARMQNSKMLIICRSQRAEEGSELVALGAHMVVIPEFEAGFQIGRKLLEFLGTENRVLTLLLSKARKSASIA